MKITKEEIVENLKEIIKGADELILIINAAKEGIIDINDVDIKNMNIYNVRQKSIELIKKTTE